MEIAFSLSAMQQILNFKSDILLAIASSLTILSLIYLFPSLLRVAAYFWPLFLSTALFLAAVVFLGHISLPSAEAPGEKAARGLMDYVAAAQPQSME